jgi:hypothetical protein
MYVHMYVGKNQYKSIKIAHLKEFIADTIQPLEANQVCMYVDAYFIDSRLLICINRCQLMMLYYLLWH